MARADLRCGLGHQWWGTCQYDAHGYPRLEGAEPTCPICGRTPCAVEAFVGPAHPDVIARAAA